MILRRSTLMTLALLGVVTSVSSCALLERLPTLAEIFGPRGNAAVGLPYRARLSLGETNRDFTIRVLANGATLEDARESARFPATRHCINRVGRSAVDWVIDPETKDWAVTRREDGSFTVEGRCRFR